MAGDVLRSLTLAQAVEVYRSLAVSLRPGTLDPRYVAADASRAAILQPAYLCFERGASRWLHSVHLTRIPGTDLMDASSPYGYGGPVSGNSAPDFLAAAWDAYSAWMTERQVVVEYVRFHPVLANERHYGGSVAENREVVLIDLTRGDHDAGYEPRLRQSLKKAGRAGLVYLECDFADQAARFGAYYRDAMREIGADAFFQFQDDYFEQLGRCGLARLGVCQVAGGAGDSACPWLAACLFLEGAGMREYHLAATTSAGRAVAAPSFALHRGAMAARRLGYQSLYLGGGSDTLPDNSLLFFKSAYSPERLPYRTGSHVFDLVAYDELKRLHPQAWVAHPERPIFYRKV
jgi:hypothetical protein